MKKETLSLDGEKLIPAVGAECCFIHEIFFDKKQRKKKQKLYTVNLKVSICNNNNNNEKEKSRKEKLPIIACLIIVYTPN